MSTDIPGALWLFHARIMPPERFEFASSRRGPMACLTWEGFSVMLADYPESLLSMLRAGVLAPDAAEEALELQRSLEEEW